MFEMALKRSYLHQALPSMASPPATFGASPSAFPIALELPFKIWI
jgi:hypothetical protein